MRDDERTKGRPLYIVAHSWGTVLIHDALLRLDRKGETIEVRRLVTLGSPLVPHRLFVRLFKDFHDLANRLQRRITRPAGVREWVNLWAQWDPYSNAIAAADRNIQVDLQAQPYAARIKTMIPTSGKDAVERDLHALRNAGDWHESYRRGFRAVLGTIGENVSWDILQQNLLEVLPAKS
jgi:pimeloyl-ACP methyl ester carboxylesterase